MVDQGQERNAIAEANLPLIDAFIRHHVGSFLLTVCGGYDELKNDLYEAYLAGITAWLEKGRPGKGPSTFIFKQLIWALPRIREAKRFIHIPVEHLQAPSYEPPQEPLSLNLDRIPDQIRTDGAPHTRTVEDNEFLREALAELNPKWQHVVIRFYGLDGRPPQELSQIAAPLGMSRQSLQYRLDECIFALQKIALQAGLPVARTFFGQLRRLANKRERERKRRHG